MCSAYPQLLIYFCTTHGSRTCENETKYVRMWYPYVNSYAYLRMMIQCSMRVLRSYLSLLYLSFTLTLCTICNIRLRENGLHAARITAAFQNEKQTCFYFQEKKNARRGNYSRAERNVDEMIEVKLRYNYLFLSLRL